MTKPPARPTSSETETLESSALQVLLRSTERQRISRIAAAVRSLRVRRSGPGV